MRQRRSLGIRHALANPEVRQRRTEALKRTLANPEVRRKRSENSKRLWTDPNRRQRWSEARKRSWADPEVRQRIIEGVKGAWTPERRATLSTLSKKRWKERNEALQAPRRRPVDWWDRPLNWRIIGDILLSRDGSMSNRELAKILDKAQIIEGPDGGTWAAALSSDVMVKSNAATALVTRVRRWVNKPGSSSRAKVAVNHVSHSA